MRAEPTGRSVLTVAKHLTDPSMLSGPTNHRTGSQRAQDPAISMTNSRALPGPGGGSKRWDGSRVLPESINCVKGTPVTSPLLLHHVRDALRNAAVDVLEGRVPADVMAESEVAEVASQIATVDTYNLTRAVVAELFLAVAAKPLDGPVVMTERAELMLAELARREPTVGSTLRSAWATAGTSPERAELLQRASDEAGMRAGVTPEQYRNGAYLAVLGLPPIDLWSGPGFSRSTPEGGVLTPLRQFRAVRGAGSGADASRTPGRHRTGN